MRAILSGSIVCVALSYGCGAGVPAPSSAPAPSQTIRHTNENLNAVLWMQTAVEYRASALQAYRSARLALDAALADPTETAAVEQTGDPSRLPPAIVLDLDETVLDNSAYQARAVAASTATKGVGYDTKTWSDWVKNGTPGAVPGAVEFLQYARSRGVTPFYITNRDVKDADGAGEAATRRTLEALRVPLDANVDTVLMLDENGWSTSDKGARRAFVAARYRILLLIGDNFEDFVSVPPASKSIAGRDAIARGDDDQWGSRWIVLPNPTYGSWEQAITGPGSTVSAAALEKKYDALKLAR